MAGNRLLRHTSSGAITLPQFHEAFQRVWLEARHSWAGRRADTRLPRRLGLAVSGGADSMALAYLCKQWEQSQPGDLSVTAFVVDHKAREESTREARMVSRFLADIGVTSQILELSWPPPSNNGPVTAFETHARRLRFQALGTACRNNHIEALLMGHHQDDNIETTLWRLCSGARGAGLAGIPSMTRIPECHGIYGVAESGSSTILRPRQMSARRFHITSNKELHAIPTHQSQGQGQGDENSSENDGSVTPVLMSTGGVFICRPLLNFPKTSLLATCHENNVPYVSDPTNFDPTLTPRNAIRSLISSHRLPRALQTPSILSLLTTSQSLLQRSTDLSNNLLSTCKILDTNLQTGTIAIRFPASPASSQQLNPPDQDHARIHQIQTLTLRRITELISPFPESHFPLRSFEKFTHRVFPSSSSQNTPTSITPRRQAFTLGGVIFQPLRWESSRSTPGEDTPISSPSPSPTSTDCPSTEEEEEETNTVWLLSRQPYMRNRLPVLQHEVSALTHPSPSPTTADGHGHGHGHTQLETNDAPPPPHNYTQWTLWDNRYWFRFALTPTPTPTPTPYKKDLDPTLNNTLNRPEESRSSNAQKISLVIRPFQPSDLQTIRQVAQETQQRRGRSTKEKDPAVVAFLESLARHAPGQVRFTIPLLEVVVADSTGSARRVPLALPTLGLWLPNMQASMQENVSWTVHWEWMYKMIDTEPLKLMGSL